MARIPLRSKSDLPDEYQYLLSDDVLGERNIFRAMGHNPPVFQSYIRYGSTLWRGSGLKRRTVELVILAVARACRSRYEWHQHVELGLEAGLTPDEIKALGSEAHEHLAERDRALVEYVRAVATDEVTSPIFEAVSDLDDRTVVGVTLLAGHYLMTARMLSALDVPTESPFVGWQPDRLE